MPSSPPPRRVLAAPRERERELKAGQQQRHNNSDIRQADRGAKLVFGGKLTASRATSSSQSDLKAGQAGKNNKSKAKGTDGDPWLASWQPKAKPPEEEKVMGSAETCKCKYCFADKKIDDFVVYQSRTSLHVATCSLLSKE